MIKSIVLASDVDVGIVCSGTHDLGKNHPVQSQMKDYRIEADNALEFMQYYNFKDKKSMFQSLMAVEIKDGVLFVKRVLNDIHNSDCRASEHLINKEIYQTTGLFPDGTKNQWQYKIQSAWKDIVSIFNKKPSSAPKLRIRIVLYRYDKNLNIALSDKGTLSSVITENYLEKLNIVSNSCQDSHIIINGNINHTIIRLRPQNKGHIKVNGLNCRVLQIQQSGFGALFLDNSRIDKLNLLLKGWGQSFIHKTKIKSLIVSKENFNRCILSSNNIDELTVFGKNGGGTIIIHDNVIVKMISNIKNPIKIKMEKLKSSK